SPGQLRIVQRRPDLAHGALLVGDRTGGPAPLGAGSPPRGGISRHCTLALPIVFGVESLQAARVAFSVASFSSPRFRSHPAPSRSVERRFSMSSRWRSDRAANRSRMAGMFSWPVNRIRRDLGISLNVV